MYRKVALLNATASSQIQKNYPYTGDLDSEMSRDSQIVFLHSGDVLGHAALLRHKTPLCKPTSGVQAHVQTQQLCQAVYCCLLLRGGHFTIT